MNDKNLIEVKKIKSIIQYLISRSQDKGLEIGVSCVVRKKFFVSVRYSNIESIEQCSEKNLTINIYNGIKIGQASTSDFNHESISTTLEKACYIASFTEDDYCVGLAEKELLATQFTNLELYHPWDITIPKVVILAKEAESRGLSYDKYIFNTEGSAISSEDIVSVYANSNNFFGIKYKTLHSISSSFVAKFHDDMQRNSHYTVACDFKKLENHIDVACEAARLSIERLQPKVISTRRCAAIFISEVAAILIYNFIKAVSGPNIYRKSSFLLNKLHKKIFSEHIEIIEDPLIKSALGSNVFDDEGVQLNASHVVSEGILERYFLDSYSARKLHMRTTGNAGGIHNIIVKSKQYSTTLQNMLKNMHSGLLITELLGGSVNSVTGDYSYGVFGFWIENGEKQYPVTGITIAGNFIDTFMKISSIGNDIDYRNNILTGSILINEITIAGK